jgi:hypothetical protein
MKFYVPAEIKYTKLSLNYIKSVIYFNVLH